MPVTKDSACRSSMLPRRLMNEARNCRAIAKGFEGRPEHAFLFHLAAAFDELAADDKSTPQTEPAGEAAPR